MQACLHGSANAARTRFFCRLRGSSSCRTRPKYSCWAAAYRKNASSSTQTASILQRFPDSSSNRAGRRQFGFSSDEVVFGFVGSFIAFHGAAILAEAFVDLARAYPNARLLLIGDGDERPRVTKILGDLVGQGRVVMTGQVPPAEIPTCLSACDVVVSPHVPLPGNTPFFGSPTKLFEYMAAGKAIVASRLGQIAEVLEDDRTALLVEAADPAALVAALKRLAGDRELRERLGRNAQTEAQDYTWLANAQRVVEAFESLPRLGYRRGMLC